MRRRWTSWRDSVAASALARIFLFIGLASALGFVVGSAVDALGWSAPPVDHPLHILGAVLARIVPALIAYLAVVRWVERRSTDDLTFSKAIPLGAAGFACGAALMAVAFFVLWLAGAYRVISWRGEVAWAYPLLVYGLATAVLEETIFRGMLFRILEEKWGVWAALAVSSLIFGGVHLGNPGATFWTSFAVAVEAGVLLGAVYHVTRSLPACIGLHMAWNFLEGTLFGSPVSGLPTRSSWLQAEFSGPSWLTGGAFGIEGSAVTVALSLAFSAALLVAGRRLRMHTGKQKGPCYHIDSKAL